MTIPVKAKSRSRHKTGRVEWNHLDLGSLTYLFNFSGLYAIIGDSVDYELMRFDYESQAGSASDLIASVYFSNSGTKAHLKITSYGEDLTGISYTDSASIYFGISVNIDLTMTMNSVDSTVEFDSGDNPYTIKDVRITAFDYYEGYTT